MYCIALEQQAEVLRADVGAKKAQLKRLLAAKEEGKPGSFVPPSRAPRQWDAYTDPATGNTWWWCEETQEATFTCPPEVAES